jgi:hypothetical protein
VAAAAQAVQPAGTGPEVDVQDRLARGQAGDAQRALDRAGALAVEGHQTIVRRQAHQGRGDTPILEEFDTRPGVPAGDAASGR